MALLAGRYRIKRKKEGGVRLLPVAYDVLIREYSFRGIYLHMRMKIPLFLV
jgi:hypothetical protein